jgi:hypothetical protein
MRSRRPSPGRCASTRYSACNFPYELRPDRAVRQPEIFLFWMNDEGGQVIVPGPAFQP